MKIKSTVQSDLSNNMLDQGVVRATYSLLRANLNAFPPLGEKDIDLVYDPRHPIVYWPLNPDKYVIGLTVQGNYPLQMIYQIAHELCHIFIDPRINGLFVEIICQKTAIDAVEVLGPMFMRHKPDSVSDYILDRKRGIVDKLGMDYSQMDESWIKHNYGAKCEAKSIYDREFNDAVAFKLKDLIDTEEKFGITVIRLSFYLGK